MHSGESSFSANVGYKSEKNDVSINSNGSVRSGFLGANNLISDNPSLSIKNSMLTSVNFYKNGDVGLSLGTKELSAFKGSVKIGAEVEVKASPENAFRKVSVFNLVHNLKK